MVNKSRESRRRQVMEQTSADDGINSCRNAEWQRNWTFPQRMKIINIGDVHDGVHHDDLGLRRVGHASHPEGVVCDYWTGVIAHPQHDESEGRSHGERNGEIEVHEHAEDGMQHDESRISASEPNECDSEDLEAERHNNGKAERQDNHVVLDKVRIKSSLCRKASDTAKKQMWTKKVR